MRPTFRLQRIPSWTVSLTPIRANSLPYSKIKSICYTYRQKLLAARTAPDASNRPPPATFFICQPSPSYAVSPQLAGRLSKDQMASLKSKLGVYRNMTYRRTVHETDEQSNEEDCIPEVLIDQDLNGDCASYYGNGQLHVICMIDMYRIAELDRIYSVRSAVAEALMSGNAFFGSFVAVSYYEQPGAWIHCETDDGIRKVALLTTDADHFEGIATASFTLNIAVPMQGVDPISMCPHIRLESVGGATGPFTSLFARGSLPASSVIRGCEIERLRWTDIILREMTCAVGIPPRTRVVDHAYALGSRHPDLRLGDGRVKRFFSKPYFWSMRYHR